MKLPNQKYLQQKDLFTVRAGILKAMAHPTRLFIVKELEQGERCVCELTDMIGADVSTVSKHLAQLKQAGLVLDDKRGNQVFYRLRVPCVLGFLDCVEKVIQSRVSEHKALLQAAGE